MRVYIPTYRRTARQITWQALPDNWKARTTLVCGKGEAEFFSRQGVPVLVFPDEGSGIAPKRQFIVEHHADVHVNDPVALMLDDDFRFAKRRMDDPGKFVPSSSEDVGVMLDRVEQMMKQVHIGGASYRSGANRHPVPVMMNNRINGFIALNAVTAVNEDIRFDKARFMEDFQVVLRFLTLGYPNALLTTHCWQDVGINASGGCSEYRDHEGQRAAAEAVVSAFPGLVSLVERPGWGGSMAGTRADVVIQWKRAVQRGREYRDVMGLAQEPEPDFTGLAPDWESDLI